MTSTKTQSCSAWVLNPNPQSPSGPTRTRILNDGPFSASPATTATTTRPFWFALSDDYLEGDLVAILHPPNNSDDDSDNPQRPRLCVVRDNGSAVPLCTRLDDVETDLFADPRQYGDPFWERGVTDADVVAVVTATTGSNNSSNSYGEGFYGQRPVPSLGGGPGYGADADEVWSVSEELLQQVRDDGVELPVLDTGIAHGEKARGGSF